MTASAAKVLEEALGLPDDERASVAARLLESLEGPAEDGADEAWRAEIAHRLVEVERGEVELVPWSDVKRRLAE